MYHQHTTSPPPPPASPPFFPYPRFDEPPVHLSHAPPPPHHLPHPPHPPSSPMHPPSSPMHPPSLSHSVASHGPGPFMPQQQQIPPHLASSQSSLHYAAPASPYPPPSYYPSQAAAHLGMPPSQPSLSAHPSIIPNTYPAYPAYPAYPTYPNAPPTPAPRMLQTAVVKLEISGKGLRDRDTITKSDPTCVVFLEQPRHITPTYSNVSPSTSGQFRPQEGYAVEPGHAMTNEPSHIRWREIARTECIKNNLNPHFKVQVTVPYHFGELQYIRLGLWDIDSKKSDLSTHDFLGDVRTTLGELVTARVWKAPLSSSNVRDTTTLLGGRRDLGTITVIVHENRDGSMMLIKGSLSAQRLDKKDLWSSDPYFIITQVGGSFETSRSQLYKSEVIRRNCNPVWRPFQIKATLPKGANKQDVILEFLVYDKDRFKRDNEIGLVKCSVAQLEQVSSLPVISEKKKRKRGRIYKNSGSLEFNRFRAFRMPSLVDYLQGGLKLHFSVAVDLTASNGNPQDRRSLHYRDAIYPNCYIRALSAIANVLRVYTPSDNMFTAFGFGAELPSRPGFASSCFPLGLGPEPHCHGIEGILQAYNVALNSVKLSGPTDFAPIIDKVSTICAQRTISQSDQHYDVLLILTDGVVSDYERTVERIITASSTVALSIIIIGIGDRDFKRMEALDSDNEPLTSADKTRQAIRDICQFVAFKDFEQAPPERLGAAVLAELPENIVEYFVGIKEPPITPGQRPGIPPVSGY